MLLVMVFDDDAKFVRYRNKRISSRRYLDKFAADSLSDAKNVYIIKDNNTKFVNVDNIHTDGYIYDSTDSLLDPNAVNYKLYNQTFIDDIEPTYI
jgi:hypothetical protein